MPEVTSNPKVLDQSPRLITPSVLYYRAMMMGYSESAAFGYACKTYARRNNLTYPEAVALLDEELLGELADLL